MDQETAKFIISLSGTLLFLMLGTIGFFISRLISDVKVKAVLPGLVWMI